ESEIWNPELYSSYPPREAVTSSAAALGGLGSPDGEETFKLFEASAKVGTCVEDAFLFIARAIRAPKYDFDEMLSEVVIVEDDWSNMRRSGRSCAC
ncbi:hypothetical protein HK101_010690, partial [Irineochytrium annulatum]